MNMPMGMYDDKIKELMRLLEESEAQEGGTPSEELPMPSKEEIMKELVAEDEHEPLTGNQAAMVEFQMMMRQFEVMAAEYERLEAEEAAQKRAAEKGSS